VTAPAVCGIHQISSAFAAGSHGLGPFWVVRTVFPINPLESVRRGTITRECYQRRLIRAKWAALGILNWSQAFAHGRWLPRCHFRDWHFSDPARCLT
jgi:hypothetical protein